MTIKNTFLKTSTVIALGLMTGNAQAFYEPPTRELDCTVTETTHPGIGFFSLSNHEPNVGDTGSFDLGRDAITHFYFDQGTGIPLSGFSASFTRLPEISPLGFDGFFGSHIGMFNNYEGFILAQYDAEGADVQVSISKSPQNWDVETGEVISAADTTKYVLKLQCTYSGEYGNVAP